MWIMDNLLGVRDGAVSPFMSKAHTSSSLFLIEGKWALVASAGRAYNAALSETITGLSTVNPFFSAFSLENKPLCWPPGIVLCPPDSTSVTWSGPSPTCLSGFLRPTERMGNSFSGERVKNYFFKGSRKDGNKQVIHLCGSDLQKAAT